MTSENIKNYFNSIMTITTTVSRMNVIGYVPVGRMTDYNYLVECLPRLAVQ